MPLLDHDNLPGARRTWGGLLHMWAVQMLSVLNPHLHDSFWAEPVLRRTAMPDDLGYFPEPDDLIGWQPPPPDYAAPVEFVALDVFETRVRLEYQEAVAAVVAFVAPSAKANSVLRRALADRYLGYLMEGAGVVMVDIVANHGPSVTADLIEALRLPDAPAGQSAPCLHAMSLRPLGKKGDPLEVWQANLAIGAALPMLPLWVGRREAVPLDLETSYVDSCRGLRIPATGP